MTAAKRIVNNFRCDVLSEIFENLISNMSSACSGLDPGLMQDFGLKAGFQLSSGFRCVFTLAIAG